MAAAGLSFEQDLASNAESAAGTIASDQSGYDTAVANAYYTAGANGSAAGGLEGAPAAQTKNYDTAYSTTLTSAVATLASSHSTASWSSIAAGYAAQDQTQSASDIQQINSNYAADLTQAAANDAANLASGQSDRAAWLGNLQTSDSQLIQTAQGVVASAASGGNASVVTLPTDLAPPTNLDLGSVALPLPLSQGWLGAVPSPLGSFGALAIYNGASGVNYSGWGDIGHFSSSYATNNWTNLGIVASPSAYDVLGGLAANPSAGAVFTGGGYSNVFNFGIGGSFAYQYGASLANWYGTAYASLNVLGGTFVAGQGSGASTTAAAVQQEQTAVLSTESIIAAGNDVLAAAKNSAH